MTATVAERADLRVLTDAQLAEVCADTQDQDSAAALAEAARRRQANAVRRAARERQGDWHGEAYANYEAALSYCKGDANMLSEAGRRTGREAWPMLWEGGREAADLLASHDLIVFWDYHQARPPSPAEYAAAERAAMAEAQVRTNGEGEAPMTTREDVARYRAEAPPVVMEAARESVAAIQARNLAEIRTAAGLDASGAPAGLRAPEGRAQVATRPQRAAERHEGGSVAAACNPSDGVAALCQLSQFHQHYDYWEAPEYADLLAAWELQNHAIEDDGSPIWRAVGRIIVAGMHGTGKDGTMAQIAMATGSSVLMKVTYAGIRDCIAKDHEAAILNEAQITFGTTGKASADVRVIVNAHVKGNMIRDGKHGKMNVFGQVAMAGLPKLLTGKVSHEIEDTLSRCFVLWKVRKPKGWIVPEVTDAAEATIRGKAVPAMREWCAASRPLLRQRAAWFGAGNPTGLPDLGGGGRGNDQLARPLLAVCDVATALAHQEWAASAQEGDEFPAELNWHDRIRRALVYVSGAPVPGDDESPMDGVAAELEEEWAQEASGEDILASMAPGLVPSLPGLED